MALTYESPGPQGCQISAAGTLCLRDQTFGCSNSSSSQSLDPPAEKDQPQITVSLSDMTGTLAEKYSVALHSVALALIGLDS